MNQVAPGWYPDPEQANSQRYWDGGKWTEQRAPLAPPQTPVVVVKQGNGCLKAFLIIGAILAVLAIGAFVLLGSLASKVSTEIKKAEALQSSIVAAGGVSGDPAEVADVVPTGSCEKDEVGFIKWPLTITNSSSKMSSNSVAGVVEKDGVKVGDLNAYVPNVGAGQTAKDKLTSLDSVEGSFTCRIVKVDRSSATG